MLHGMRTEGLIQLYNELFHQLDRLHFFVGLMINQFFEWNIVMQEILVKAFYNLFEYMANTVRYI